MKFKIFYILSTVTIILLCLFKIDKANKVNDAKRFNKIEILDNEDNLIYSSTNYHDNNYQNISDIPQNVKDIFIFLEDKRFYSHQGLDFYRIGSSILTGSKSGASTITQQLIKNMYFTNKRSILRKIKEAYLSTRMERNYTKDEILEIYLNTLYFNHNIYGIKDAAFFYFNKELSDLTISEIVILSNIIKNPTLFSPILNYKDAIVKKNSTLHILYSGKIINKFELESSIINNPKIYGLKLKNYPSTLLFYKDKVMKELSDFNIKSDFNQTVTIRTNYDKNLNILIDDFIRNYNLNSNTSLIVLDKEGYYVSLVGGKDYYESTFNAALSGSRTVASTIKPLLYYEALNAGFSPQMLLESKPTTFKINGQNFTFNNYANIYEDLPINMGFACATSDNIYALKTHVLLKLEGITRGLNRFGIKSQNHIEQALGNVSLSLNELSKIYYSFQTLGYKTDFKTIKSIYINDHLYYKNYQEYDHILNSDYCFILNDLLTYMFDTNLSHKASVTGASISSSLVGTCAGKSGLDDYNSYMIGFNPSYTIACWTGFDDMRLLNNNHDKTFPKQLFKVVFNELCQKKEDIWYKCPSNIHYKYENPVSFNKNYKRLIYYLD